MARQNQGSVSVDALDSGTRFVLRFPLVAATAEAEPVHQVRSAAERDRHVAQILIVEHADEVRDIAARILRSAGFRTLTASHGRRALELLDTGTPVQLILTGLQMPVMDGHELFEEVQRRGGAPRILFMTGHSEDSYGRGLDPGVMLLAKPFTPERLVEFVRRGLASR